MYPQTVLNTYADYNPSFSYHTLVLPFQLIHQFNRFLLPEILSKRLVVLSHSFTSLIATLQCHENVFLHLLSLGEEEVRNISPFCT